MSDLPAGDSQFYLGQQEPGDSASEFNALRFLVKQMINGVWTATLVQIKAVHGGGLAVAGTVDVQPMVNQIDGYGNATAHGTIYGVPYVRLQGGANAIIIDPIVGDIGLAIFADHDISSVIASSDVANPGSLRRFSPSDALYIGGLLNAEPTQYIQFSGGIVMGSPAVSTTGNLSVGSGATGSFSTPTGQVVTVVDGIITDISP